MGVYQDCPQCPGNVLFISAVLRLAGAREEVPERHRSAGGVGACAHAHSREEAQLEHTHTLSSFEGNR
jgi:hypothetical protein